MTQDQPVGAERAAAMSRVAWIDPGYGTRSRSRSRPWALKIGCGLTWVFSGMVTLTYIVVGVSYLLQPATTVGFLMNEMGSLYLGLTAEETSTRWLVIHTVIAVWSVAACVLAVFVWRRNQIAWGALLASTALAFVVSFYTIPLGLLQVLATVTALPLLASAYGWLFRRKRSARLP